MTMFLRKIVLAAAMLVGVSSAFLAGPKPAKADPACGSSEGGASIICYDPIHRNGGSKVTVSSSIPGFEGPKLIDQNLDTKWNSGGYAPAWFQIDMRGVHNLKSICMIPGMKPTSGTVSMEFTVKAKSARRNNVWPAPITTFLQNGVPYCIPINRVAGQYITVTTLSSPSWVGWREIQVTAWYACKAFACNAPP